MGEIFHHYVEIMSDPAHLMAEITLMLLIDVLFLGLIWPVVRKTIDKRVRKEHAILDKEHGIDHND
jgi:hypothetical protein